MGSILWFIVIGALLIVAVVTRSLAQRLSLSMAMFYLGVGFALGPVGFGLIDLDAVQGAWYLERLTEIAVILSLFSAGLKLSPTLTGRHWRTPLRLAFLSMTLTVGGIALIAVTLLQLSWGEAILLGAVLAPTDPVLASDVQVKHPRDRDRLRFSLTGEASLNDGTAFPFVMLGLGLLGLHEIGQFGWRWVAVDVFWATLAGLGIGAGLGLLVGRLVLYLRTRHRGALGMDEFLALGLVAFSYGVALALHAYGFLAVFAAGLALRRIERQAVTRRAAVTPEAAGGSGENVDAFDRQSAAGAAGGGAAGGATGGDESNGVAGAAGSADRRATDPATAPAHMTEALLAFNEKIEHIGEFIVMLFVGAVLAPYLLAPSQLWLIALLFFVIRPLAVTVGLLGVEAGRMQVSLISWFGIRGLGSIYYLCYAIQHGVTFETAEPLTAIVLTTVTASVILHGLSVPSLMRRYHRRRRRR